MKKKVDLKHPKGKSNRSKIFDLFRKMNIFNVIVKKFLLNIIPKYFIINNSCQVCNSRSEIICSSDNHLMSKRTEFKNFIRYILGKKLFFSKITRCNSCGFSSVISVPTEKKLIKFYKNNYWDSEFVNSNKMQKFLILRSSSQTKFILKSLQKDEIGNVLDIGGGHCATSLKLREIQNYQLKLFSLEENTHFIDYYIKNKIEQIKDLKSFKKKFKIIIMSHSLEHFANPLITLKKFINYLENNGYIFVEVPNTTSDYWLNDYRDNEHLSFFTLKSLEIIGRNLGLTKVSSMIVGNCLNNPKERENIFKNENLWNASQTNGEWIRIIFKK